MLGFVLGIKDIDMDKIFVFLKFMFWLEERDDK